MAQAKRSLRTWERISLNVQNLVAQAILPFTYYLTVFWLKVGMRYRIPRLTEFRKALQGIIGSKRGPILICPNHLTMIDSLILIWAMGCGWTAYFRPKFFPWNTPEKRNFGKNPLVSAFCYIGKCLQVLRQGPQKETQKFMDRVKYLFSQGHTLMIFPEGTRSRSGTVDTENFTYGVGKIVDEARKEAISPRVLCLYMRGKDQQNYGFFPKKGETFFLDFKMVDPQPSGAGLRAARDIASQIIEQLSQLENNYFANRKPCWE